MLTWKGMLKPQVWWFSEENKTTKNIIKKFKVHEGRSGSRDETLLLLVTRKDMEIEFKS